MHGNQDSGRDPSPDLDQERDDSPGQEPGVRTSAGAVNGPSSDIGESTASSARSAEQRLLTTRAIHEAELTVEEVWLRYFSFSGAVAEYEVHAYLQGLINLPRLQRDLLAQAVNELIDEQPDPRRAPFDVDFDDDLTD